MLERALNTVRCRNKTPTCEGGLGEEGLQRHRRLVGAQQDEIATDGLITVTALVAHCRARRQLARLLRRRRDANVFEVIGIMVSFLRALRAGAFEIDLERESPLTKLAGPVDCDTSAVLLVLPTLRCSRRTTAALRRWGAC